MDLNMFFCPVDSEAKMVESSIRVWKPFMMREQKEVFLHEEDSSNLCCAQFQMVSYNIMAEVRRKYVLRPMYSSSTYTREEAPKRLENTRKEVRLTQMLKRHVAPKYVILK